VKPFDN
jgi:DNA repair ATPase RecN